MDNSIPFERQWEIPITITEHTIPGEAQICKLTQCGISYLQIKQMSKVLTFNCYIIILPGEFSRFYNISGVDGSERIAKVVYVDNPLPPRTVTMREKNSQYHSIALLSYLQHPNHGGSVNLGGETHTQVRGQYQPRW